MSNQISVLEQNIDNKAGVDGMSYIELLTAAHSKGLKGISVEIIQFPTKENELTAVCSATVILANETLFTDIADASPESVNDVSLVNNLLRVASTRAKSRALRDALGIGITEAKEAESNNNSGQNNMRATVRQINAISKLCKQLGKRFDPDIVVTLNKVAASRLITQLNEKLRIG